MLIYDVLHKEKIYNIVSNELKSFGVKYQFKRGAFKSDKSQKVKNMNRKVFKTPLSYQPLDIVHLSSGGLVHVPVFVSQATTFLQKSISQEGLFRKAGSQTRQKELIAQLDNGGKISENNQAIDVANCLKTFFRDLPEPLIPYTYHDLFIHCIMLKSRRVQALLLACILLPPYHLNTLAFFMEFLKNMSLQEKQNKMSIDNLAKVVGPNLMPLRDVTMSAVRARLELHLIIIKTLIENAQSIGVLPDHIIQCISNEMNGSMENEINLSDSHLHRRSRKKKHRSGSLTRMFTGLKKIVRKGGSPEDNGITDSQQMPSNINSSDSNICKTTKKRKALEQSDVLSTRKKKVNDKLEKPKKIRLSLDRFVLKSKSKPIETDLESSQNTFSLGTEQRSSSLNRSSSLQKKYRRYSDGSSHVKPILKDPDIFKRDFEPGYSDVFIDADVNLSDDSNEQVLSTKNLHNIKLWHGKMNLDERQLDIANKSDNGYMATSEQNSDSDILDISFARSSTKSHEISPDGEYVRIPKSEYEDIKNRVSAIETRISQEFGCISNETTQNLITPSVNRVQTEYEKTLEESSIEAIMSTDHLAKRLGKELKIRRSGDHKIIRSPSARKIGILRRRSQEKGGSKRVRRTASWHVSQEIGVNQQLPLEQHLNNTYFPDKRLMSCTEFTDNMSHKKITSNSFCEQEIMNGLKFQCDEQCTFVSPRMEHNRKLLDKEISFTGNKVYKSMDTRTNVPIRRASSFHGNEIMNKALHQKKKIKELKKTISQQNIITDEKIGTKPLQNSKETVFSWKDAENYFKSSQSVTPISQTGRASVAKLRTQNAGMVLAKAKLFDENMIQSSICMHNDMLYKKCYINIDKAPSSKVTMHSESTDTDFALSIDARKGRSVICHKRKNEHCRNKNNELQFSNAVLDSTKEYAYMQHSGKYENDIILDSLDTLKTATRHEAVDYQYNIISETEENESLNTALPAKNVSANMMLPESNSNILKHSMYSVNRTPNIKRPLTLKTPKSSKSLIRRPVTESRRTPLKAVTVLGTAINNKTPKNHSKMKNNQYIQQ